MKKVLLIASAVLVFFGCSKSGSDPEPVHCDGLVTDTAGTGDNGRVYMPTAFTPNSDGLNDNIRPFVANIASFTFTLYDQNNAVIFTSNTAGQGYSSAQPAAGSFVKYYYKVQATTLAGKKIGVCGDIYKLNNCRPASPVLYFEDQLTPNGFTGVTAEVLPTCP